MVAAGALQVSARLPEELFQKQTKPPAEGSEPAATFESVFSYEGLTVADIKIPEVAESDQKSLRQLIVQQTGKPLDRELIRGSIHALYATGRFADIRVEAERDAAGQVRLSFITSPNYF